MAATDQVVVGNIPRQSPGFHPPTELLAELNRAEAGVSVIHAVTQTKGVGKTQLAAAYAREKLAEDWRLVAWVNARDPWSLRAGLAAVADAIGLPGGDSQEAGQAVRRQLEGDGGRCLLVFDDVADPEVVRPFVPDGGAGRILITTTQQSAVGLGTGVPVDVFGADRAREFLAERTGLRDEAGAAVVADELGYLPLALAQAATVIAARQLGYETYLEMLRALPAEEHPTGGQDRPYPDGAAQAVLLSLDAVPAFDQTDVCTRVMEIVAVLSADGVRRELLHAAGQRGALASGQRAVPGVVDRAVEQLADRSLLTLSLDGRTILVHRLITQVVRERLVRRRRLAVVGRAAAAVLEAYADALTESQDPAVTPAARDLAEQVAALRDAVGGTTAEGDKELAAVLLRVRFRALYHLIELDDGAHAIAVGEPLIADLERALGPDHADTLNARNSLAAAYQAAGRLDEAIPLFERTLVDRERVLGPDHPDTLNSQNNLAVSYQDTGRLDEAILLFRLTLAARERLLGAHHPSTVNSRGNLAAAYRDAGRLDEAIPLFELALAARERLLGGDHPDTMRSRNNLASAYRKTGQVAKAIPLVERILAGRERLLGADHPRTLAARNNLAAAYRQVGRAADAIPLFEQTLAACERLLGAEDPRTLATRKNLALAYTEADRAG